MTPEALQRQRVRVPVLAATSVAWVAVVLVAAPHGESGLDLAPAPVMLAGHVASHHAPALALPATSDPSLLRLAAGQVLMLTAMLAPLLIATVRHVLDRSLPGRRARAVVLMLTGYVATWSLAWALLLGVAGVARAIAPGDWAAVVGLAVLVVWQASPAKQRLLNCCHAKPPLAAFGRAADLDALSLGHATARTCFGTCWALMLLPLLLATHSMAVMALAAGWMWAERLDGPAAPTWRIRLPVAAMRLVTARARAWARTPARAARVR